MEIKLYFRMLQRGWWIIAVTTLTAVLVALIASYLVTPIYRATTRFVISPSAAFVAEGNNVLNSLATLDKRSIITTYAEIFNSPRNHRETYDLLQLNASDVDRYNYAAVVLPDTNIIEFSVEGPNPQTVTLLVNSVGQHALEYIQGLYMVYEMSVLDPGFVPSRPISPQPVRDAGIALVVGLALGVVLALTRELIQAPIENFMQQRKVDPVSLALNRTAFEERLSEAAFASTSDFSFCLVRLEGLDKYMNVLPQPSIQSLLRHVTRILRDQLRGNDLVGRWNELNFGVLLFQTPGDASVNTMARVRQALSAPIKIDLAGEEVHLNPQIGIAEYRVGDTVETMVKNVKWALDVAEKNNNGMYLLKATQPI